MTRPDPCTLYPRPARGFTLLEVMISIAIVLALIIGVNQVFKVAADTVGTGMALSSKIRDGRAAQAVLYDELNHVARDGPFLIISSRAQAAFETPLERSNDRDGLPRTLDFDGNNDEGEANIVGERIATTAINSRNHRLDLLSFFARDLYRRQTGNNTPFPANNVYAADQSSNEAWITYGHLRVYNQTTPATDAALDSDLNYLDPGAGTPASNPKNYYASDWPLGRVQMLLIPPEDTNTDGYGDRIELNPVTDATPQQFWKRKNPLTESSKGAKGDVRDLEPLGPETQSNGPTIKITDARYDLAGTTFDDFTTDVLTEYIKHTVEFARVGGAAQITSPSAFPNEWWDVLAPQWNPATPNVRSARFRSNPYPARPLTARKIAQASPVLLSNCTQFIVEFAGDFLTQQVDFTVPPNGIIDPSDRANAAFGHIDPAVGPNPDGIIDFYIDATTGVQKIRWYGLPRDLNGDGIIRGNPAMPAVTDPNLLGDVVPVRDVLHTVAAFRAAGSPTQYGMPFERTVRYTVPTATTPVVQLIEPRTDYARPNLNAAPGSGNGMSPLDRYVVAWGPGESSASRPQLIRLIITLADPTARLSEGQTFEYVVNLP